MASCFERALSVFPDAYCRSDWLLQVVSPSEAVIVGCNELDQAHQLFCSVASMTSLNGESSPLVDVQTAALQQRTLALRQLSCVPSYSISDTISKAKMLLQIVDILDTSDLEVADLAFQLLGELCQYFEAVSTKPIHE